MRRRGSRSSKRRPAGSGPTRSRSTSAIAPARHAGRAAPPHAGRRVRGRRMARRLAPPGMDPKHGPRHRRHRHLMGSPPPREGPIRPADCVGPATAWTGVLWRSASQTDRRHARRARDPSRKPPMSVLPHRRSPGPGARFTSGRIGLFFVVSLGLASACRLSEADPAAETTRQVPGNARSERVAPHADDLGHLEPQWDRHRPERPPHRPRSHVIERMGTLRVRPVHPGSISTRSCATSSIRGGRRGCIHSDWGGRMASIMSASSSPERGHPDQGLEAAVRVRRRGRNSPKGLSKKVLRSASTESYRGRITGGLSLISMSSSSISSSKIDRTES